MIGFPASSLAAGLAPRRREDAVEPVAMPVVKTSKTVEIKADAVTAPAMRGTAAYYLARLQRDHPAVAARVTAGEISVYAACLETGIRKAPAKAKKWTTVDAYLKPEIVTP